YRHHIGICHLNLNENKTLAIPYLEWVTEQKKYEIKVWYDLGRAYSYVYRFDDAIKAYEKYISLLRGNLDPEKIPASRRIEMCENAKIAIQSPINVTIENLGDKINSKFPDYNPYIPQDESMVLFTSQRKGNIGNYINLDGYITADIYQAVYKSGKWKGVRRFTPVINTQLVEELVGMTPDGSRLFLYFDNFIAEKDLFISQKRGKGYLKASYLGININTEKIESAASMSPDFSILYFSSDKEGGKGGKDIYYSILLPDGSWGEARNLGDVINTEYDDDFPYIGPDGKTLYFCSVGHNSMGDYDLFKSVWDNEKQAWSEPVNVGYPVNSPEDNKTISITSSGRHAYISALRKGGVGNLDIYRVTFNDIEPTYSILKGGIFNAESINAVELHKEKVKEADSVNTILYTKAAKYYIKNDSVKGNQILEDLIDIDRDFIADITVYDKRTESVFGKYRSNRYSGQYAIILPPGDYKIVFKAYDYNDYIIDNIHITDRDSRDTFIIKQILLESEHDVKYNSENWQ
ncbi:MAG: PD40 domain-containing protein, partial [Bacteroidetes bacterium]|nr:PD40 domain-containing protein [Bacteroidota bacterium]